MATLVRSSSTWLGRRPCLRPQTTRRQLIRPSAVEYPEALLFDCDGVLVDTEKDGHRVAFNAAFKRKGKNRSHHSAKGISVSGLDHEWDVDLYGKLLETGGGKERMTVHFSVRRQQSSGHTERETVISQGYPDKEPFKSRTVRPSSNAPIQLSFQEDEQQAFVKELHLLKTDIFMEMVESGGSVEEAVDADVPLAVCSTSNERAVTAIVQVMLGPEVAEKMRVFAGDVVPKKKPSPDIYHLAAEQLDVNPAKCVVVEDSAIGLQAAKAAGMKCVVTRSSYTQREDFSKADGVYDCIGEKGEERFSLADISFQTTMK